jgi:hypothetical protein
LEVEGDGHTSSFSLRTGHDAMFELAEEEGGILITSLDLFSEQSE